MVREKFTNERPVISSVAVVKRRPNSRSRSHTRSRSRSQSHSRSKSRSRSRSNSKRKSRSRSFRRSRSRSNTHTSRRRSYTKSPVRRYYKSPSRRRSVSVNKNDDTLDARSFRAIIQAQQTKIEDLLCSQKAELEERIDSKSNFRQKRNERQFSFNTKVLTLVKRAKSLLKDNDNRQALYELRDTIKLLETQNEDLLIADSSKFGWLTVSKIRGKDKLSSNLQKKIMKIDSSLDKNHGENSNYKKRGNRNFKKSNSRFTVQTERSERKGPAETLQYLKTRKRSGVCTFCSAHGHFWRECPTYWEEVNKSRDQPN